MKNYLPLVYSSICFIMSILLIFGEVDESPKFDLIVFLAIKLTGILSLYVAITIIRMNYELDENSKFGFKIKEDLKQ